MPIEPVDFRRVMSRFATGVTVVTTRLGQERLGITVNAFSRLSLEPQLVLICIERTARAHDPIARSGVWAVNVLAESQRALSDHFARVWEPPLDPFEGVEHTEGVTGAPLLPGCLARLECRLERALDGGDHTIFVGRVVAGEAPPAGEAASGEDLPAGELAGGDRGGPIDPPLLYFGSRYRRLKGGVDARDPFRPW